MKYGYYKRDVSHLTIIDPYRLQQLYEIPDGPIFHAWKKLIAVGQRGGKNLEQDVQEAIDSLQRLQEMWEEDKQARGFQFCAQCGHSPVPHGDKYGCPNCHGEGLE